MCSSIASHSHFPNTVFGLQKRCVLIAILWSRQHCFERCHTGPWPHRMRVSIQHTSKEACAPVHLFCLHSALGAEHPLAAGSTATSCRSMSPAMQRHEWPEHCAHGFGHVTLTHFTKLHQLHACASCISRTLTKTTLQEVPQHSGPHHKMPPHEVPYALTPPQPWPDTPARAQARQLAAPAKPLKADADAANPLQPSRPAGPALCRPWQHQPPDTCYEHTARTSPASRRPRLWRAES